jgi:hypothetical protein
MEVEKEFHEYRPVDTKDEWREGATNSHADKTVIL